MAVQGEYVAPEKIENVYTRSALVAQVFVYGDSLRSQLVAVAVPDPEAAGPWAQSRDLPTDMAALCKESQFQDAVLKSLIEEGRAAKLQGFEQVSCPLFLPLAEVPPPPLPPVRALPVQDAFVVPPSH